MTVYQLKAKVEENNPESLFFSRNNMNFAGDSMKNYGVRETTIQLREGSFVHTYELYRKNPVKEGVQTSAYFDKYTFKLLHGVQV